MRLLFPCDPLRRGRVDADFAVESEEANVVGLATGLYSHGELTAGDAAAAVRHVPAPARAGEPVLLRGWMVNADTYTSLHSALAGAGVKASTAGTFFACLAPVIGHEASIRLPPSDLNLHALTELEFTGTRSPGRLLVAAGTPGHRLRALAAGIRTGAGPRARRRGAVQSHGRRPLRLRGSGARPRAKGGGIACPAPAVHRIARGHPGSRPILSDAADHLPAAHGRIPGRTPRQLPGGGRLRVARARGILPGGDRRAEPLALDRFWRDVQPGTVG